MTGPSRDAIKRALDCGRPGCECGRGRNTHCPGPSHRNGDRDPSLTVDERNGTVLFNCKGTCPQEAVIAELQERGLWPRPGDDEDRTPRTAEPTRIVATYEYHNPDRSVAFQVIRKEGYVEGKRKKAFTQRRPDGQGGWIYKKGDTSILYRLPELQAADPSRIVFLPEGEKDVDNLAALGLVATTRAEGAGKWTDANSAWLDGRRVCILPDNDAAGEKDAAKKLASLSLVAAQVAVLPLDGVPPDGGDVSDWLEAGGSAGKLEGLAEAALAAVSANEPKPAPQPSLASFPTSVLPPSMAKMVRSASTSLLVPPEFLGVPLLVLAGATIGNAWEIELKSGWREGPNLYAAIVADPGAKKTPALKIAMKPIYEIQKRLHRDYRDRKAAYEEERALWERIPKKERGAPPEEPAYQHAYTTDATTEALAEMLAGSKGMALVRDELVGWVRSMDVYHAGGKGADRQHYLSMWSRAPIKIDRKSRPDPIIVERPCLSVVGGIQPDILPDLVEHEARDDGFLDRLLFAYPDLGSDRWTDDGVDEIAVVHVENLFAALYELEGAEMPSGDVVPRVARLDPGARALWRQWYDAHQAEYRSEGLASSLKGTWAKLPGQLARLTLILHVAWAVDAQQPVSAAIPEATLAAAADLMEFFKEHARAALAEVRTPRSTLEDRVLRGLRERGECLTRTIHRDVLKGSVKADRLKATLERLLEDGRVSCRAAPSSGKGGRPGQLWGAVEDAGRTGSRARSREAG
jgi:hypothetical protein